MRYIARFISINSKSEFKEHDYKLEGADLNALKKGVWENMKVLGACYGYIKDTKLGRDIIRLDIKSGKENLLVPKEVSSKVSELLTRFFKENHYNYKLSYTVWIESGTYAGDVYLHYSLGDKCFSINDNEHAMDILSEVLEVILPYTEGKPISSIEIKTLALEEGRSKITIRNSEIEEGCVDVFM